MLIARLNRFVISGVDLRRMYLAGGKRGVVVTRLIQSAKLLYAGSG